MIGQRRRFAVAAAWLVGLPLVVGGLVIAAVGLASVLGTTIDGSRWRDTVAERMGQAIDRTVVLQGPLQLQLGRQLSLRVGGVRILSPPGFSAEGFVTIGEARARIDVFDLLRGRWRLRSVDAADIGLWLERDAGGQGNWAMAARGDPAASPAQVEVDQLMLRTLVVHYRDAPGATPRRLLLDEVTGSAGVQHPLRLEVRGSTETFAPYSLKLNGGPLSHFRGDAEPWPFTLQLKAPGASLRARGEVDAHRGSARFQLDADAADVASIERLSGIGLPRFGAASLYAQVRVAARAIEVTQLQGRLGESDISGQLVLDLALERPRLSGALSAGTLDLWPLLADDEPVESPSPDAAPRPEILLRQVLPIDVDVKLKVARWAGLPIDVRDADFSLRADARGAHLPISAILAGIPLVGRLDLGLAAPTPDFTLQVGAKHAVVDGLLRELTGAQGLAGTLAGFDLRLHGRGETPAALRRSLDLSVAVADARLSLLRAGGAGPIDLRLDTLQLAARDGERLRAEARGWLRGERASLSLRGGSLAELRHPRAMPFEAELALAQATLRVASVLATPGTAQQTVLAFDLQAARSGDLAGWLPIAPESALAVALRGRVRLEDEAWRLDPTTLQLGRSQLVIDAHRRWADGRPLTVASVRGPLLDLPQLLSLHAASPVQPAAGPRRDAPIAAFAHGLPDVDLGVDVQRVHLGRTELRDLGLAAQLREGQLVAAPVRGRLAGAPMSARVELDLRDAVPQASLELTTGPIDIGLLLRELGVAEDIEGRTEGLHLTVQGRGATPRELAANASMQARFSGGHVSVLGAAQRPVAELRVDELLIDAPAGEPVRLRLDGALAQSAVKIEIGTGTLADFTRDASRLPFALRAQAAGTRLGLDGEVALPLGRDASLVLTAGGDRLDTLSDLARVELPAWGPWSLSAPIRMTTSGYELQGLLVQVGQSRLQGDGRLDIDGPRPRLQLQLAAPHIQLDDFPPPPSPTDPPAPPPVQGNGLRAAAARLAGRTDSLLSAKFLRRFDASIDVKAQQVLSGTDRLANGELHLEIDRGRLRLDPVVVNLPGGSLRLTMAYDLKESEVDFAVSSQVERFDYGIIARRLRRADDLKGLMSMNLQMSGTAPSLDTIMRNANGRMDFAVWPTELSSGMFNLWSANLVLTLLPLIDPGAKSQVNCIVGRFDLKDGNLSDDKILIDTSRVRIRGAGHANLATEELAFVFRPRAKGFGLFRLQTPLRVGGTLTDQRFYFDRSDVVESTLRLIASPILWPIERLTLGPLPIDGADLCTDPLRARLP